jgi:hypothetical protein
MHGRSLFHLTIGDPPLVAGGGGRRWPLQQQPPGPAGTPLSAPALSLSDRWIQRAAAPSLRSGRGRCGARRARDRRRAGGSPALQDSSFVAWVFPSGRTGLKGGKRRPPGWERGGRLRLAAGASLVRWYPGLAVGQPRCMGYGGLSRPHPEVCQSVAHPVGDHRPYTMITPGIWHLSGCGSPPPRALTLLVVTAGRRPPTRPSLRRPRGSRVSAHALARAIGLGAQHLKPI